MRILGAILAVILLAVLTMTVSAGSMVLKLRFNNQAQMQIQ